MKIPKFRVGQVVSTAPENIPMENDGHNIECTVLYPIIDGTYFLRVNDTGGFAIVPEEKLGGEVEMGNLDSDFTASRHRPSILFFGNGTLAVPMLYALKSSGYDIKAVVTNKDKEHPTKHVPIRTPVRATADKFGIPQIVVDDLHDKAFLAQLRSLGADLGIVVDYRLIPPSVFTIPPMGVINLHTSLLPAYRGSSTIASAIMNGEDHTGITTIVIEKGVDKGKIINNLCVPIYPDDTHGDVLERVRDYGATMLIDAIERRSRNLPTVFQTVVSNPFNKPSYAPKIFRQDSRINFALPATKVYDFIRALSPYPAAWMTQQVGAEAMTIKIFKAVMTEKVSGQDNIGSLVRVGKELMLVCWDYMLKVYELQPQGRKRMTAEEFINGYGEKI